MGGDQHLEHAFRLASGGHAHPNPHVGCVIVAGDGAVVGEGFHRGPGTPHAEIVALGQAQELAAGSTMYVSLEPCTHTGLTPPCVEAIAAAGVASVVVGALDPDDRVSGRGIAVLESGGISVEMSGVPERARQVDPAYFRHRETGLPTVTLKYAMTLDGAVAAVDGSSQWISGHQSRIDAHQLRSKVDAVVIGAGTLRADNPRLDVRHVESEHQPRPIIISGRSKLPSDLQIWERNPLVVAPAPLTVEGGEVLVVDSSAGLPDPEAAAHSIAAQGYLDLLLEGGPALAASWWDAGLVQRGIVYIGGKIAGGPGVAPFAGEFGSIKAAVPVNMTDVRQIGPDLRVEFE